ncbi:MAG: biotin synthase BioB [Proteobacteria bacterium]|nr:biotin synthase BioB [Pseudomonadota bacterium]
MAELLDEKTVCGEDPAAHELRHDWQPAEALAVYGQPFNDLLYAAHTLHRRYHPANQVQISTLLSVKTGGCPEDCAYCPQAAQYDTGVDASKLMDIDAVVAAAKAARAGGASRFCMGAAWRNPKDKDLDAVCEMVREVKGLGLETCVTLGMLTRAQAERLHDAGLDYYNHNLDTSPEYYGEIITTRTYQDRLDTLAQVRDAGIHVCCGGIVGMGESTDDRVGLLIALANLPEHPESVPINMLMQVDGTPLFGTPDIDPLEFARMIATARIMMPRSVVRLSAGREMMSDELQALCFFAGANSIFCGDTLLTTANPGRDADAALFARLGIAPTA